MEICRFKVYIQKDSLVTPFKDKTAEWLRRWTVNPLVSARVGSNPIFVDQNILPGLEEETFWVIGTHDNDYNKKSWQDQVKIFLIMLN